MGFEIDEMISLGREKIVKVPEGACFTSCNFVVPPLKFSLEGCWSRLGCSSYSCAMRVRR